MRLREAREVPRVAPETPDSYQNGGQALFRESPKNEKQKRQKLKGNLAPRGKMLINTGETSGQTVRFQSDLEEHEGARVCPWRPQHPKYHKIELKMLPEPARFHQ